jgi:ATP-dependent DNA ligase
VTKVATGFTEQDLQEFTSILKPLVTDSAPEGLNFKEKNVDVWL